MRIHFQMIGSLYQMLTLATEKACLLRFSKFGEQKVHQLIMTHECAVLLMATYLRQNIAVAFP